MGRASFFGRLGVGLALAACTTDEALPKPPRPLRVLFFQEEGADVGWYHTSTPLAERAMRAYGETRGWEMTTLKDSGDLFRSGGLTRFDVVVYLLSSGTVLDADERKGLQDFIALGKGYVGVHSASFTDPDWDWYIGLVGSRFHSHADSLYSGRLIPRPNDPATASLPSEWVWYEQWYKHTTRPEENPALEILLSLDETSLPADYPEAFRTRVHPIAWRQLYGGGRSFYTSMGHADESFDDALFVRFIGDGIEWAGQPSRETL